MSPLGHHRTALLGQLARFAEQKASAAYMPGRRVAYAEIAEGQRKLERATAISSKAREITGNADGARFTMAARSSLGCGAPGRLLRRRGASKRLRILLRVAAAFERAGEGLRLEEIAAASKLDERELHPVLEWATSNGVLALRDASEYFFQPNGGGRDRDPWLR